MMFSKHSSLVFIDATVPNYESLVRHVQPDATVVILNAAEDGIAQMTKVLADRTPVKDAIDRAKSDDHPQKPHNSQNHTAIATIHVVSHGTSGELQLGSTRLNAATLNQYAEQIRSWSLALSPDAAILLYGCEVATGATGEQFVQQLHHLTQAEIAASTNLTGSQDLGGDWRLDYATGEITATLAFDDEAIATYAGVLARDLVQEDFQGADVANPLWLFGVGAPETPGDPVPANPFLTARATAAPAAGGLPGGGTDTPGAGALRLTGLANDQSSFVLYNGTPLPATEGVSVIFDFYAYAGTGADGISFFLLDGAASPTTSGAFGGSLGYAQKTTPTRAGITGGVLGIGFDEYGNFANETEGRVGGAAAGVSGLLPDGRVPDAVTIRGSAATRYPFISTSGALSSSIDRPDVAEGNRAAARRRAKIDITPVAGDADDGILTVKVDFNNNGSFQDPGELVIDNLGLNANGVQLPSTFKFGFASSTGSQTNIHEVNNLLVRNLTPGLSAFDPDGSQLTRLTTREGDAPLSLSLSLDSRPTSNVTVTLSSADTSEGTIAPTTLTFTPQNWDSRQTFALAAQDDTEIDGDITYNVVTTTASTDTRYSSATPTPLFSVTNRDNEVALPTVSLAIAPATLIESSPTPATITATLSSAATTPVTLTLGYTGAATQSTDYTAPATITIPVGATTGTATITPTNDTLLEGAETVIVDIATATGATPVTPPQPATLTLTDSVAPGTGTVTVAGPDGAPVTQLTTREGDAPLNLGFALDSRPTSNVTVTLSSADPSEGTIAPTTLTFTPADWDTRQTVTLTPQDDTEVDGDVAYNIVATTASTDPRYSNATPAPILGVTNRDNESVVPTVSLAIAPATLIESSPTPATITATLSSAATTPVTLTLGYTGAATQGTDYTAPATITIPAGALTGTATITPTDDALIEGPETVIVGITTATGATPVTPSQPATLTLTDSTTPTGNRLPIFAAPAGFDVQSGQTVGLPGISASDPDPDGSIAFYTITQVPPAAEGALFIGNPAQGGAAVVLGQQLTGTQIGQLFFRSTPQFNGDTLTITATDNRGDSSSTVVPLRFVQVLSGNDEEDFNCQPGRNQTGSNARNVINGSIGSDRLIGRDGNDVLRGLRCNDLLDGGRGNDRILGGTGRDNLRGGVGNDFILGERGADVISGGVGNDRVLAGVGNDFANGNVGRDSVDGGAGDDIVNGGAQQDIVVGGVGNDLVIGAAGDDRLFGSAGEDALIGALGRDKINARGGSDRIIYRARSEFGDRIDRFEVNQDVIDLRQVFRGGNFNVTNRFGRFVQLQQSGRSTVVRVDTNGTAAGGFVTAAEVFNVPRNTMTASNFLV